MKKVVVMIITIVLTLAYNLNVSAKDAFKSINKYKEESLEYIIKSYNENEKNDGMICAGTYLKDKNENNNSEYNDTQIILVKYNRSSHGFNPTILNNTTELYIGIKDFHPASPALVNIFHIPTIVSTATASITIVYTIPNPANAAAAPLSTVG